MTRTQQELHALRKLIEQTNTAYGAFAVASQHNEPLSGREPSDLKRDSLYESLISLVLLDTISMEMISDIEGAFYLERTG